MFKLSTASLFRLVAIAAIGLAFANWWPRALPPRNDGSVTWYHGIWGPRAYYKVTGTDRFGCTYSVAIQRLPSFSPIVGEYPDGSPREESHVYVTGSIDGAEIHRDSVTHGRYFAPDGTQIGLVENGTGNVKYCRPDGTPQLEYELVNGTVTRRRVWWKNGHLQSERNYRNRRLHGTCTDYYPNGTLRFRSTEECGVCLQVEWFDQNGKPSLDPVPRAVNGNY